MPAYEELRKMHKTFTFSRYHILLTEEFVELSYDFSIDGLARFSPRWQFAKPAELCELTNNATFERLVFNLGLAELVSYWKLACPPEVRISAGALDKEQRLWWKNLYFHGLGEFFFCNGLQPDAEEFMCITSQGEPIQGAERPVANGERCLIPIGGGKDSVVTLETLRSRKESNFCYIINPRGATKATADIAGYPESRVITARRTLDPAMLRLNGEGFLNGHTPFSAIVAFSSLVAAYLRGINFVALSNESSANESTVPGSTVNHQYSKSFAFEQDFVNYEKRWIGSNINYFSLLRPLTEYRIAQMFARFEKYHTAFRSCNSGSKTDAWCGQCPKCLFVYLILSPFLRSENLFEIFGKDLLQDADLIPVLDRLTGVLPEKPFECVGSRAEVNLAVRRTIAQRQNGTLPVLLKHYQERCNGLEVMTEEEALGYSTENLLPAEFAALLKSELTGAKSHDRGTEEPDM